MNKLYSFLFIILLASSSNLLATSTIQFNTTTLKATGFNNAAGTAAGGLSYGIVVDTARNGFVGYDAFVMPTSGSGLLLRKGSDQSLTDDFFFWNGQVTNASVSGTDGGTNSLPTTFANIPNGTNGIDQNDPFAIIWFSTGTASGNTYGLLTDPLFIIGADGGTTNVAAATALANTTQLLATNVLGVPEPSRMILLGFGLVGVFFRRRR